MNRILVVEDEPELRAATAAFLRDSGYPIVTAADAVEAMRLIVEQRLVPSLVLLDLVTLKTSGMDFFQWLKARPEMADVPVLIATGARTVELPPQVTAVLRKPYRPDRLLAVVDALCGNSPVGRAEAALRARTLRMGGPGAKPS